MIEKICRLFEGPQILESFKPISNDVWMVRDNLPSDIEEQIKSYELSHPILAHIISCRCYRCIR